MTISPHTFEGQEVVRKAISDYVSKNGVTSLRKISAYVKENTGIGVAPTTVGRLLRKMKLADRPQVKWEENINVQ